MGPAKTVPVEFCHKLDLIVWIPLSTPQVRLYETFLESEDVRKVRTARGISHQCGVYGMIRPLLAAAVQPVVCCFERLSWSEFYRC